MRLLEKMCACSRGWIGNALISSIIFFRFLDTYISSLKNFEPNFSGNSFNSFTLNLYVQAIVIFSVAPKRLRIFHIFEMFVSPYV